MYKGYALAREVRVGDVISFKEGLTSFTGPVTKLNSGGIKSFDLISQEVYGTCSTVEVSPKVSPGISVTIGDPAGAVITAMFRPDDLVDIISRPTPKTKLIAELGNRIRITEGSEDIEAGTVFIFSKFFGNAPVWWNSKKDAKFDTSFIEENMEWEDLGAFDLDEYSDGDVLVVTDHLHYGSGEKFMSVDQGKVWWNGGVVNTQLIIENTLLTVDMLRAGAHVLVKTFEGDMLFVKQFNGTFVTAFEEDVHSFKSKDLRHWTPVNHTEIIGNNPGDQILAESLFNSTETDVKLTWSSLANAWRRSDGSIVYPYNIRSWIHISTEKEVSWRDNLRTV